ncbi:conserved protein of unknown function [Burkholderia multivorans]
MADVNAALIGLLGVMAGGYLNNFFAEDYKRFLDGRALAGALAGELESHAEPVRALKEGLQLMEQQFTNEHEVDLPEWPIPASPLFEQNAAKIGLLGAQTARDVAYVYENLRAFRLALHQLSKHHTTLSRTWCASMTKNCMAALTRAETRGVPLIEALKSQANESYWQRRQTRTQLKWAAVALFVFLIVLKVFA